MASSKYRNPRPSPKANIQQLQTAHNQTYSAHYHQLWGKQKLESLPRTVAVVEDDPSMRRSIERLLNAHGHRTLGYETAETFLEADLAGSIGCLVLDIHLADMSGIQLRRWLRDSGSDLPVIFITAVDDEGLEAEARDAGCVAYLHKPFAAKLLLSAINATLAGPDS